MEDLQEVAEHPEMSCDIMVGPMAILGTGVNLTRARKIVILDVDWLEASAIQAIFRIHRIGQLNPCHATILRNSAVEIDRSIFDTQGKRSQLWKRAESTEEQARQATERMEEMQTALQASAVRTIEA